MKTCLLILSLSVFGLQPLSWANLSKTKPVGTNESVVYYCDQWLHYPAISEPDDVEALFRENSKTPSSQNILFTYYVACDQQIYGVKVKYVD